MAEKDLDIFGNSGRSGYSDIVSMGPSWWTEYLEMDTNYRYAGWTVDLMAYQLDRVVNNLWPRHADEATIRKLEILLKIIYDETATLDERRRTVEAYFSGSDKLSKTMIQNTVKSYTGADSEVWWIGNELNVRILGSEDVSYSDGKLANIISRRMPSHLPLRIRDILCKFELEEKFGYRATFRIPMVWWDGRWSGAWSWDGQHSWDAEYPTIITPHFYITSENPEPDMELSRAAFRTENHNGGEFAATPVVRVESFFYEGRWMFNDRESWDDGQNWDGDMPPTLSEARFKLENKSDEEFTVQIVKRAGGLYFDGSAAFDDTYTWNIGKEIL